MECKPNILAYTVDPFWEGGRGQIVRIVREGPQSESGKSTWQCVGNIELEGGAIVQQYNINKAALRPVYEGGDNSSEATLLWAGLTSRAEVAQ